MIMKKFFVSIGIEGITANYEATVEAENEQQAEEKVRDMYNADDYENAEVSDTDFNNSDLMDKDGVYIKESEA